MPLRLHTKRPGIRWRGFQSQRPEERKLEDWFGDTDNAQISLGAILGPVSGGLLCRDFDQEDAYDRWKRAHEDLAKILPTVQTRRGKHVYVRCPTADHDKLRRPQRRGVCFKFPDGELRGDKHIVALPPSIHGATGQPYRWLIPPGQSIPIQPLHALGFMPPSGGVTQVVTELHPVRLLSSSSPPPPASPPFSGQMAAAIWANGTVGTKGAIGDRNQIHFGQNQISPRWQGNSDAIQPKSRVETLKEVFDRTVPNGPGQRNSCIFSLARHLKSLSQYEEADAGSLRVIFSEWHRRALPHITQKDLDWNFGEFLRAWDTVRIPAGTGSLANALARACAAEMPPEALQFPGPQMRLLVKLCRELQIENGDRPFFLSCRDAARAIGIGGREPHVNAHRWLKVLCEPSIAILHVVRIGEIRGRRATEYRYLPLSDGYKTVKLPPPPTELRPDEEPEAQIQ